MNPKRTFPALAVLTLAVGATAAPILRTAPCPELTRSSVYNGQPVDMVTTNTTGGSGWLSNGTRPPDALIAQGHIQNPLTPQQSINCVQVPPGLRAEIVATEQTPGLNSTLPLAYLMYYTFDERGRMWAVDVRDYPYTHDTITGMPNLPGWSTSNNVGLPSNRLAGRSRVVILEDTNGDGSLDHFKEYFTGLALPTSLEIVRGGVIVTVPPFIYFLPREGANPDTSTQAIVVVSNMGSATQTYDTHGQPNSLTRGLDNFLYGHTGYNGCGSPIVGDNPGVSCGNGNIWRFKATLIGSDTNVFQVHGTGGPSNAHGIGQMEDGQWFKSGATLTPHSNHQPRHGVAAIDIRNASGGSGNTASNRFYALTNDRWLWEGDNTPVGSYFSTRTSAVSGHDFYTSRLLPRKYWNTFAFTCEGASGLCNQDSLVINGSTWAAHRLYPTSRHPNIFGSTDAWSAPLKVRTGPDGGLWVNDWYNYLFLHNPASPATNAAWRHPLRAKSRSRIYRILPENGATEPVLNLTNASAVELVNTFYNPNFLWRLHAQRILIERGYSAELGNLLDSIITKRRTVDSVGNDAPVLHALWTLEGLGRFKAEPTRWDDKLRTLLLHPSWMVRRNVPLAMPATVASTQAIKSQCAVNDPHPHVRIQALAGLIRMPEPVDGPVPMVSSLRTTDTHSQSAFTAAGGSKVMEVTERPAGCPDLLPVVSVTPGDARKGLAARNDLRFDLRADGFALLPNGRLGNGELVVHDLRGQVVFRSTWNAAQSRWSNPVAANLRQPVYFYSFREVSGASFNGRIALAQF